MSTIAMTPDTDKRRETFFKLVFGKASGYVCVAHGKEGKLHENYFKYPDELPKILTHINQIYLDYNTYFCPQLLRVPKRIKENVSICPNLWSDLDACPPDVLLVPPTIVLESSAGRYQGFWVLNEPIDPETAEDLSRRIAYYHEEAGADRSGWDLTQLLRVPLTYNLKYDDEIVQVKSASNVKYDIKNFEEYPQAKGFEFLDEPFPENLAEFGTADQILEKNRRTINPRAWSLFYTEPDEDWSKDLWQLELLLFESELKREEVFIICHNAACNKYRRDKRDPKLLWKEILRAESMLERSADALRQKDQEIIKPVLLTNEQRAWVFANPSFIEMYVDWAKTLGDAAWQYHQVGAFVILSSLFAGTVRLPTSYGLVIPNLWFMILADTTLTRKTTAMDIATDIILDIDSNSILATDGSIEGLFQSLSTRPGRPSIFLRDEFSGLLESMTKKDYMAGMSETLTKMYDGKFQKRVLKREVIEVRDPVLIMFTGGIKTRVQELLTFEHVSSGFIPRFLFVSAESDITRLKPLGPPTDDTTTGRDEIIDRLVNLFVYYHKETTLEIDGKITISTKKWDAQLTSDAWVLYNRYEADLVALGLESDRPDLMTPTFDRMAKSGLKMAVLLAASRGQEGGIYVEETDIIRAFYYIEEWSLHTLDLINNIGKNASERTLERIVAYIRERPGVTRSTLMQNFHLSSRDATLTFDTLEQRGLITRRRAGKAETYYPTGEKK